VAIAWENTSIPFIPTCIGILINFRFVKNEKMRVPGFGPAAEVLLFRQKDPKPLTPRSASLEGTDAGYGGRSNSLRSNKARRIQRASDPRAKRQASVRSKGAKQTTMIRSLFGRTNLKKASEAFHEKLRRRGSECWLVN